MIAFNDRDMFNLVLFLSIIIMNITNSISKGLYSRSLSG